MIEYHLQIYIRLANCNQEGETQRYLLHGGGGERQQGLEQEVTPDAQQLRVELPSRRDVAEGGAAVELDL